MRYEYPKSVQRILTLIWLGLLILGIGEYLIAWARVAYALVHNPLQLPNNSFLIISQAMILPMLFTAHIGLILALIAGRAVAFLAPHITLYREGLMLATAFGSQWIPFTTVRAIYSTELSQPNRFVVWVNSTKGSPVQGLLGSLIFGRWLFRGFLLTSDLAGFDHIVATMVDALKQKYGNENFAAHFIEEPPSLFLRMLAAPRVTLHDIATAEPFPISREQALRHIAFVTTSLLLPIAVAALIHLEIPWASLLVLLIALGEFPLVAFYFSEMPVDSPQHMSFETALRAYPLTQLPRWVSAIGFTLLVIAGVPSLVMAVAPLPAIALGAFTAIRLTEEWFQVKPPDSWLGALATVIYQLIVYELLLWTLPR